MSPERHRSPYRALAIVTIVVAVLAFAVTRPRRPSLGAGGRPELWFRTASGQPIVLDAPPAPASSR
jgi:hypothetical protein